MLCDGLGRVDSSVLVTIDDELSALVPCFKGSPKSLSEDWRRTSNN